MPKQIIVPDGMVEAVMANCLVVGVCQGKAVSLTAPAAREVLRRALEWLSENPIQPTPAQIKLMHQEAEFGLNDSDLCAEWQRRMFLEAEPNPVVVKVENTLAGCTLTRGEANELISYINMYTHG